MAENGVQHGGHVYAWFTCTRVRWEDDSEGNPLEDPITENGWVDWSWSPYVLHEGHNDVRPAVDCDLSDRETLQEEIADAFGKLGAYESTGNGTFYAADGYQPLHDNPEGWNYTYALHFSIKFLGPNGWTEEEWDPAAAGFEI